MIGGKILSNDRKALILAWTERLTEQIYCLEDDMYYDYATNDEVDSLSIGTSSTISAASVKVRNDFPESWIWQLVDMTNETG